MSTRFRPQMDVLEAREVPAAGSFVLPDGAIGSALFTAPDGVDPNQSWQSLPVDDLSVAKGGAAYTVQPGATAQYVNGTLIGLTATANGPDTIQFNNYTIQVGGYMAPVVFDGADTEITFTLPDGTVGAISYDTNWELVDPQVTNQAIPVTAFNLNIAGQNLTYGSADYTQSPTLLFANGVFQGVNFALSPPQGFTFSSISMAGLAVTAVKAGQQLQTVAAAVPNAGLDFKDVTTSKRFFATIEVKTNVAGDTQKFTLTFAANTTAEAIRDAISFQLDQLGYKIKDSGTTRLLISGRGKNPLTSVAITFGTTLDNNGDAIADATLLGPKLFEEAPDVTATYNGNPLSTTQ